MVSFPSGGLDEKNDAGKLAGFLLLYAAFHGLYHYSLSREGRVSKIKSKKRQRKPYWDTVSALDLRYGSHVGWVSRTTLGLYRWSVAVYCTCMWVLYMKEKACCSQFLFFEAWNFTLFTLYFFLGVIVSVRPVSPGRVLRAWEKLFVILFETIVPTTLFLFVLYWRYTVNSPEIMFPSSNKRWVNDLFTCMNFGLLLGEIALNRIVLRSRRWMYFSYFAVVYLIYIICVEKLEGNNYMIYKTLGFLRLSTEEFPRIVKLFLLHFSFHYVGCILVTLKQRFWTLPLTHPIQGAVTETTGAAPLLQ